MKRNLILLCAAILTALPVAPAFADHGSLGSTQRDAWINEGLARLAAAGYLPAPKTPFDQQTNLEAAEDVARASERLMAQANTTPELPMLVDPSAPAAAPAVGMAAPQAAAPVAALPAVPAVASTSAAVPAAPPADMKLLVEEYKKELAALGVDLDKLKKRLNKRRGLFAKLSDEQLKTLNRAGSDVSVYSRGYINGQRIIGQGSISHDGAVFNDIRLRSVPVPKLLFEATLRLWGTYGYYYVDPGDHFEMRSITLTSVNKAGTFQAGDFFRSLSPLTLWNPSEVTTLVESRVAQWRRMDREELVMMDHGSDWRLRGVRYRNEGVKLPVPVVNPVLLWDFMGGPVKIATTKDYGNYWSGAQVGLGLFDHKLDLLANGLRYWDEPTSAPVSYIGDFTKTWCQRYEIGGLNPRLNWEIIHDLTLKADWDGVTSKYHDDLNNNARYYQDWASITQGSLTSHGVEAKGKVFNIGPNFYNPGSQTLRYTPGAASSVGAPLGYVTSSGYRDTGIIGYKDRFLFTDVTRPQFAAYDRLEESILPYGDATPNRKGFTAGVEAKLLKKGWLHPQAWYTSADEIEPNWVRIPQTPPNADKVFAVDSETSTATARTFTGVDAALQADLAAALGFKSILAIGGEFKTQTSDLGYAKMKSKTIVGTVDLPPSFIPALFVPIDILVAAKVMDSKFYGQFNKWFKGVDFNFGYRQIKGSGQEYGLSGTTLAEYAFQPVSTDLGSYTLQSFDITRTELTMGVRYQITKTLDLRADWLQRTEKIENPNAPSETRTQEWRMMYEASF